MELGLTGKTAFVSGASSGIGEAIAHSLAAEGVKLAICARRTEELNRVAADIKNRYKTEVHVIPADLSQEQDIIRAVAAAHKTLGSIDILVCNTGGPPAMRFLDTEQSHWDSAYKLLLTSAVGLARGFLPGMIEKRWGRLIFMTSIAVKQPVDNLILSNSIRSAVTGLAKSLSCETAGSGITANCVLTGFTLTDRVDYLAKKTMESEGITHEKALEKWTAEIPARRMGQPCEVAALVAFLASCQAAYITGQSIAVDGGWIKSML